MILSYIIRLNWISSFLSHFFITRRKSDFLPNSPPFSSSSFNFQWRNHVYSTNNVLVSLNTLTFFYPMCTLTHLPTTRENDSFLCDRTVPIIVLEPNQLKFKKTVKIHFTIYPSTNLHLFYTFSHRTRTRLLRLINLSINSKTDLSESTLFPFRSYSLPILILLSSIYDSRNV